MQLPDGPFDLIAADPPWRFKVWSRATGLRKAADNHYATMTLDDVKRLPVASVAAPDCLLWLWCTAPMLRHGFEVLDAWGFKYSTMGVWAKRTKKMHWQFGTGFRLRSTCEPFLIGTRGSPRSTRATRNLIEAKVREHSRKPNEAYAACEAMMPGARKLDMFSREERPGWTTWGNETGKFRHEASAGEGARASVLG